MAAAEVSGGGGERRRAGDGGAVGKRAARRTCFISADRSKIASSVVKSAVHSPSQHRAGRNSSSSPWHIR